MQAQQVVPMMERLLGLFVFMPWSPSDATRHTRKARTPKSKRQWAHVADSALARGQSEGSAIRQANAVVARSKGGRGKMARRGRHHKRGGKKRK